MPKGVPKNTPPVCLESRLGRPPKDIDWNVVNDCLELGMPGYETAAYIGIDHNTLLHRCVKDLGCTLSQLIQEKHQKRNANLRKAQQEKALSKDTSMLIWLGKQYLEQADKVETKTELKIDQPLFLPQKAPTE